MSQAQREAWQRLLTKKQVAAILQVSPRTVERYVKAGLLSEYRLHGAQNAPTRFSADEVERFIESSRVGADR